jgi:threonylcarbamoyladenosine tRNA methylthiotransferase MtaB
LKTISAASTTTSSPAAGTAAVLTAGCRLNQSESDALRQRLLSQGVRLVSDPAEAGTCYVNTCTVTARADRSSIQLVRRASRPGTRVVVLGCLAERDPARVVALPGVSEVWNNERKQRELANHGPVPTRARALLKVQDGCNRRCTYCVVSGLRGPARSVPAATVLGQFDALVAAGFAEVVLTGLNIGTYDDGGLGLSGLVERLLARPGTAFIRIGSIEPDTVDGALLALAAEPRVCPHFHLPLQSGDDRVLAAMRRPYRAADYRRLLDRLLAVRPEASIGSDVIAGFPGEDETAFSHTLEFLRSAPVTYLHAFAYSPRPGVTAPGRVPEAGARVRRLRTLSDERRREYERRFDGAVRTAVVESPRTALTDNYIRLRIHCPQLRQGTRTRFRLAWSEDGVTGEPG